MRRAWRIQVKRDYSEVALKRGESPPNPKKYAPYVMLLNLVAGSVVVSAILGVILGGLDYNTWTAMAGSTLWCKFFFDFAISRQAHMQVKARPQPGASK